MSTLKFACADFTFPLLPHDHVLDLIVALGCTGVDIGLFHGRSHIRPEDVFDRVPHAAGNLNTALADRGLQAADIFLIMAQDFETAAANHPDAQVRAKSRDDFQRALEFTARANGRHMTVLPGIHFPSETEEDSMARCSEELAWRVAQGEAMGIVVAIEPHVGGIVSTPSGTLDLLQRTPGLTLTLDYCHFTYEGIPDLDIECLIPRASHFHARAGRPGRVQCVLKENTIDYQRVLQVMSQTGYDGYIGLEYVWMEWEPCDVVDNLSETILLRDHLLAVDQ